MAKNKSDEEVVVSEKEITDVKKNAQVDAQAFVQNKLRTLNQKSGGRYERAAARVVQNNLVGGK